MNNFTPPLNFSLNEKIKPKNLRRPHPLDPRKPFSQESNPILDTSLKPAKLHRNSLYNTSTTGNAPAFDYFDEQGSRQEIQAFSRYCDSIMHRVSAKTDSLYSSSKGGHPEKEKISKSLAELSRSLSTFEYLKKFRSQKKRVEECSGEAVNERVLLSVKKKEKRVESGRKKADKGAEVCFLKYSSVPVEKKLTVQNSFCIGNL